MKLINILSLFTALTALVSCANNDELISDDGMLSRSAMSRSVSTTYYLDGAAKLYTGSPETFTVKAKDGSALPAGLKASWNYPSDLYRVGYDDTSITFGRKLAVGTYEIIGSLNNGQTVSKFITAIDSYKPDGTQPDLDPLEQVAKGIYMTPLGISRNYDGPFENIDAFRYVNGNHFYAGTDNLNIKVLFQNKSNGPLTVSFGLFTIAYGNSVQYRPLSVTDTRNSYISQVNLSSNSSVEVILHLGNEWYESASSHPASVVQLLPYYSKYYMGSTAYGYLFSR